MPSSGGFTYLGFSNGFELWDPRASGVLYPVQINEAYLNDFNKKQEIYTWNR